MARFQNACKRTLIFVLLTCGTIFFVPISALANGVITVTTPLNDATVTVPFNVQFTYSGTDTYTKLWIDGVAIISDHTGSVFDYTVTSLAAGKHTLSLQAHDASSNTTVEVKETITVSTTPIVNVTPSAPTMAEGDQLQFSSGGVTANWTLSPSTPSVGSISGCTGTTTCTFIAGTSQGTATLAAAATSSSASGQANITVVPLAISPASPNLAEGQQQTFTANASVTWNATGGTFQSPCASATSCVFTAGNSTGPAPITATETSLAGLQAQTTANITATADPGSTPVLTFHNDQLRSGANTTEFVLNTGNVNQSQFGLKHTYSVDGQIYAQPLYVPNLTVNGGQHNVVFVATENDTVYAFDADGLSTSALWSTSLGKPRSVSGTSTGTPIYPSVGVTSTPVIDSSTNTMYVLATTSSGYELNALYILTGKVTGSEKVTASVKGTGTGSSNGTLSLPKGCYQRPGLALANGDVYIGFSYCHQGWLLAYDASSLQPKAEFCATPNGSGGGIWMGGGAPAVDSDGYVYVIASDDSGNPESIYEDAFLKFNPDLTVADYFQTSIDPTLIKNDADQGSGGIMILPDNSSSTPHELVGGGKDGYIIMLNRDSLGHENSTDKAIQEVKTGVGEYSNIFSSPAFWNNTLYYHPENDTLHLFNYDPTTGKIGTSPAKSGSAVYGWHGATPSISANGSSDGIVWEIEQTAWKTGGPAILHAYDAVSAAELYNSTQAAGNRDKAGPAVRFTVPTVADGQVFVGTANQLDIYGLLQ